MTTPGGRSAGPATRPSATARTCTCTPTGPPMAGSRSAAAGAPPASVPAAAHETIGDSAHVYMYAQRPADGRIAIGGRGVPYRFGSGVDHRGVTQPAAIETLAHALRALFPA